MAKNTTFTLYIVNDYLLKFHETGIRFEYFLTQSVLELEKKLKGDSKA